MALHRRIDFKIPVSTIIAKKNNSQKDLKLLCTASSKIIWVAFSLLLQLSSFSLLLLLSSPFCFYLGGSFRPYHHLSLAKISMLFIVLVALYLPILECLVCNTSPILDSAFLHFPVHQRNYGPPGQLFL